MSGPLSGVRILEFSEIIAAPFAGMILSDMDAEVIKVEPPWGEPWRHQGAFMPTESRNYISLNRGKRSLPLDLTKPEGRKIVYELIGTTDVVLINYRPDTPYNLGIDYETLSKLNPRLIYCHNTAFGLNGPDSYRPGYDIIAQAMSGIMGSGGKLKDGLPQTIGATAVADFSSGLSAAWAICAALYAREKNGKGQKVETSLLGTALAIQTSRFLNIIDRDNEDRQQLLEEIDALRTSGTNWEDILEHYQSRRIVPINPYYRTYQTSDGVIAIGNLSDVLRRRTAMVLGIDDPRFHPDYSLGDTDGNIIAQRVAEQAEDIFRQKSTQEWLTILDDAGIPAGPVLFTEELENSEQMLANNLILELNHEKAGPIRMVGPLVTMTETPLKPVKASPTLGRDTVDILLTLGYRQAEIESLRELGAIL